MKGDNVNIMKSFLREPCSIYNLTWAPIKMILCQRLSPFWKYQTKTNPELNLRKLLVNVNHLQISSIFHHDLSMYCYFGTLNVHLLIRPKLELTSRKKEASLHGGANSLGANCNLSHATLSKTLLKTLRT